MREPFCPVCNDKKVVSQEERLKLLRCSSCSHTFTNEKEDTSVYGKEYFQKEHQKWFENPDYALYHRIYQQIKKHHPSSNLELLDIGCGNGSFLKHLKNKDRSLNLTGIELIENDCPGITFIQGDFNRYELNKKFDVVTSFMVIEHLENPRSFIQKVNGVMKKDSLLVINTINNNSLIYKIARLLNKVGVSTAHDRLYSRHHLNHFTNGSLQKLLELQGFTILSHKNHNYPLKAVDVPKAPKLVQTFYRGCVSGMFAVSSVFQNGHSQTVICRK